MCSVGESVLRDMIADDAKAVACDCMNRSRHVQWLGRCNGHLLTQEKQTQKRRRFGRFGSVLPLFRSKLNMWTADTLNQDHTLLSGLEKDLLSSKTVSWLSCRIDLKVVNRIYMSIGRHTSS